MTTTGRMEKTELLAQMYEITEKNLQSNRQEQKEIEQQIQAYKEKLVERIYQSHQREADAIPETTL